MNIRFERRNIFEQPNKLFKSNWSINAALKRCAYDYDFIVQDPLKNQFPGRNSFGEYTMVAEKKNVPIYEFVGFIGCRMSVDLSAHFETPKCNNKTNETESKPHHNDCCIRQTKRNKTKQPYHIDRPKHQKCYTFSNESQPIHKSVELLSKADIKSENVCKTEIYIFNVQHKCA